MKNKIIKGGYSACILIALFIMWWNAGSFELGEISPITFLVAFGLDLGAIVFSVVQLETMKTAEKE